MWNLELEAESVFEGEGNVFPRLGMGKNPEFCTSWTLSAALLGTPNKLGIGEWVCQSPGSVFEVAEGGFGDRFYVWLVAEDRVHEYTQAANLCGWGDGATVHMEEKLTNPLKGRWRLVVEP